MTDLLVLLGTSLLCVTCIVIVRNIHASDEKEKKHGIVEVLGNLLKWGDPDGEKRKR